MGRGEELSSLVVHLLLPPFRDEQGHRVSHHSGTGVPWADMSLTLKSWASSAPPAC